MIKFMWALVLLFGLLAGVVLVLTVLLAQGAPQQAAGAAIALGVAVIPYVIARGAEGMR